MTRGRPLRFLALVLGGWVAVRAAVLMPDRVAADRREPGPPSTTSTQAVVTSERPATRPAPAGLIHPAAARGRVALRFAGKGHTFPSRTGQLDPGLRRGGATAEQESSSDARPASTARDAGDVVGVGADIGRAWTATGEMPTARPARLHGGTWLIARPTGGDNLAFGQLGASQAGMRLTYTLEERRRIALSARVSAPLRSRGREAAFGIDWQPTRLPVHLLAEQRLALDGGPARPAVQLIGGVARRLPLGLAAEGYAQAGGVLRRGGFADGSARVSHALLDRRLLRIDLGGGGWGAIQRGVARVDLGPTLGLTLPARGGAVRLAVDYRLRVAGLARPGSGPAVSVGSSF